MIFFIQNLDGIFQMDEQKNSKKLLAGLDWCQAYALALGIWKKMKNRKGGSDWSHPTYPFYPNPPPRHMSLHSCLNLGGSKESSSSQ